MMWKKEEKMVEVGSLCSNTLALLGSNHPRQARMSFLSSVVKFQPSIFSTGYAGHHALISNPTCTLHICDSASFFPQREVYNFALGASSVGSIRSLISLAASLR